MKQIYSLLDGTSTEAAWLLRGVLLLSLILAGCQVLQDRLQPSPTATETPFITTLVVPTADCGTSTLLLGSSPFQIETLQPGADGTLAVPPDKSGIAYWV